MKRITIIFKDGVRKDGKGFAQYHGADIRIVYQGGFAIVCWREGKRIAHPAQDIETVEDIDL